MEEGVKLSWEIVFLFYSRGPRKGYPLYNILVSVIMDVLRRLIYKGVSSWLWGYFQSHLQFIDDNIFFLSNDSQGLGNVFSMLIFEKLFGLRINAKKSIRVAIPMLKSISNVLEGYASLTGLVTRDWYLTCLGFFQRWSTLASLLGSFAWAGIRRIWMGGKAYLFIYFMLWVGSLVSSFFVASLDNCSFRIPIFFAMGISYDPSKGQL